MMIKVGDEYLDFSDLVETEKQVKLLEDLSTSDGDFSYSFSLSKTINNTRILQNPQPDNISKPVYQKIPASLLTDNGEETFKGFLRVEKINKSYECSFFAGNNNWFGMLSGRMREIDWSEFGTDQTEAGLSFALFNTSGVVFPLVDNGLLAYRGNALLKVEDFVGAIYTKDVVNKVFALQGIKIQGDLLDNTDYLTSVILTNGKSQVDIEARSVKAHTTNSPNPNDSAYHKMVWTDDSNYPYFDGSANLFNLSAGRYDADVKMKVKVTLNIQQTLGILAFGLTFKMAFFINGVLYKEKRGPFGGSQMQDFSLVVPLDAGDYLEVFTWNNAAIWDDPITDATLEITPIFIYKAFGNAMVPDWTQAEFVAELIKQFCVLPSYDAANKTLTLDLFEKLKSKVPIDLSEFISEVEIDYSEFVSEYGKKSLLSHDQTTEEEEFRKLNPTRRSYAKGEIDVDNDFLEDEADVIESKFSAPITYLNPIFDMSIEKTNLLEFDEEFNIPFTGVIDSPLTAGRARFAIDDDLFALSDMVRITNSTNPVYNGDYMVITLGAGYIELEGIAFDTDATGELGKMNFIYSGSDQVYLLHHVPLYTVSKFSGLSSIQVENTDYEDLAPAFYNLIATNRQIDTDFPFSMAFAPGDQTSITERYFRLMTRVLNDPVKLIAVAHLPYAVYRSLDFLQPITIKTEETQNAYYLNKISGYKDSYLPCELQLIKI